MRKFAVVTRFSPDTINLPKRATEKSAGYDFESAETVIINVGETKAVATGVKAYMNEGEYLQLQLRSSLSRDSGLRLANAPAIIDSDYVDNKNNEGEIFLLIYNSGIYNYQIEKGQRVAQGIFLPFLTTDDEEKVTKKRSGGMGSTN